MLILNVYANLHASSLVPAWPPAYRRWALLILISISSHEITTSMIALQKQHLQRPGQRYKQNALLCARSVHSESGRRPANMQAVPLPMRPLERSNSHIRTFRKVLAVLVELFPQTSAPPLKPSFCSSPRASSCSVGAGLAICRGNTGDKQHYCSFLARLHAVHAASVMQTLSAAGPELSLMTIAICQPEVARTRCQSELTQACAVLQGDATGPTDEGSFIQSAQHWLCCSLHHNRTLPLAKSASARQSSDADLALAWPPANAARAVTGMHVHPKCTHLCYMHHCVMQAPPAAGLVQAGASPQVMLVQSS